MTERVYLHVGPFKTGTTYLQSMLEANAGSLRDQGVLYPGGSFPSQSRAVHDALGARSMPSSDRSVAGEWQRLADEIAAWPGRSAVISQEMLSAADRKEVRRLHARLGTVDVHVIYTARDLARVAPAMWQTAVRNRSTSTWPEYLAAVRAPRRPGRRGGRHFWRCQDAPAVLERWREHVPLENLHLVTVPRPGSPPELLWQRFCQVLGVDPTGHQLRPRRANPSLGAAEAELLRRVNARLAGSDIDAKNGLYWTRWLGRELEQRAGSARYPAPRDDVAWITERATAIVAALRATGYPVVGDLDELIPQPAALDGPEPVAAAAAEKAAEKAAETAASSDAEVLEVALDALQHTLRQLAAAPRRRRDRTD